MIPPGARIGILGGGQLGRMTALAAARLGYASWVLAPEPPDCPAAQVAERFVQADYDDHAALDAFAAAVDVVTIEFENVEVTALEHLSARVPTRPGAHVLRVTQDRLAEKEFLAGQGVPLAPFTAVRDVDAVRAWLAAMGGKGVLKTRRMGYDGKGQRLIERPDELGSGIEALGNDLVLEGFVEFALEISVVTARGADGTVKSFPSVENRHRHHILHTTIAPAPVPPATAAEAVRLAERIATALDVVGLIAVEMFVDRDGRVLVNELAPRPHNSGHWTIDACAVSQFEQLVRAVGGLPLGEPAPFARALMENLIGEEVARWPEILAEPGARLHLYGKRETRPGRKMGHVTRLAGPWSG